MRKIVQVYASQTEIVDRETGYSTVVVTLNALCDDGTLWFLKEDNWVKYPDIPQDSTFELPKPIRNLNEVLDAWVIAFNGVEYEPRLLTKAKDNTWFSSTFVAAKNGCLYATQDDCQAVCNWLMGY